MKKVTLSNKILKFYITEYSISEDQFVSKYNNYRKENNLPRAVNTNFIRKIYRLENNLVSENTANILCNILFKPIYKKLYKDFSWFSVVDYPDLFYKFEKEIDKYYFKKLSIINKIKTIYNMWFK